MPYARQSASNFTRLKSLAAALLLVSLLAPGLAPAQSDIPTTSTWVTDAVVRSILRTTSTIYLGGDFTYLGPQTGSGVPLSAATGQPVSAFPQVNGAVYACASDGANGWFIGGAFTQVGALARNNLAHILASGAVDPAWNPNANNTVQTLTVQGGLVYVGGAFTNVGGQNRSCLAALNGATGLATTWNPYANAAVSKLVVSGSTIYAIGSFTNIGGVSRAGLAAINTTTGYLTAWNPTLAGGKASAIAVTSTTAYLGGNFTTVNATTRHHLAAVDVASGALTAWDPYASWDPMVSDPTVITALAYANGLVYAGGSFTSIGGQTRNMLAAIDAASGVPTAWDPAAGFGRTGATRSIDALAVLGSTVYVGGDFGLIAGQFRSCLAAIDAATGSVTAWNPGANKRVFTLGASASVVYVGGTFNSTGGVVRRHLAAIDAATGQATPWNPEAASASFNLPSNDLARVNALTLINGRIYAGGSFATIDGQPRNNLAALDPTTGAPSNWDPNANGIVYALANSGSTLYVGGAFTAIGGLTRNRIAAFDSVTGAPTAWNPEADSSVQALALSGSIIYAGGNFTSIGGQPRSYIAALDTITSAATAWRSDADASVYALAISGSTVYAGGFFKNIGGATRNYIAALDASSGQATPWNPNANSAVYALALRDSTVYAGGMFSTIGGQSRKSAAALDGASGLAGAWNPACNYNVRSLNASEVAVYVGVTDSGSMGPVSLCFARFNMPPPAAPSNPAAADIQTDRITWTWLDNASDENGFQIYAAPGALPPAMVTGTAPADATAWLMSGLTANTQHAFQVSAIGAAGESKPTVPISAWTAIEPVRSLAFSNVQTDRITVAAGNALTNLSAGASGVLYYNPDLTDAPAWSQSSAPCTFTNGAGLTPNTRYTFWAKSRNAAGVESAPTSASLCTLATSPTLSVNFSSRLAPYQCYPAGTKFTFTNPAGFGMDVQGGISRNLVSGYRYAWDSALTHAFTGGEPTWSASDLILSPDTPGRYYLHLQSINGDGVGSGTLDYGPFYYDNSWSGGANSTPTTSTWVTDESVLAMARTSSTLYIGGNFTYVGPLTGSGVPIDKVSGRPASVFPYVNGYVNDAAPDGAGGWFIAGSFSKVGGFTRNDMAHILASGAVDPAWAPAPNGAVTKLLVSGGVVYMIGNFSSVNGQTRNFIAALDAATGALTPWDPNATGEVYDMAISGSFLYVCGIFSTIGGQFQQYCAQLDLVTGAATAWHPILGFFPDTLEVSGSTLYIGGVFQGIPRGNGNNFAAIDLATGAVSSWHPQFNGYIEDMAVSNGILYAVGSFTQVDGQTRKYLAALDLATGALTPWNPNASGSSVSPYQTSVTNIAISGSTVYVGGQFTRIGGQWRNYLAALDAVTGAATPWNPGANKLVGALAVSDTQVYAGGTFTSVGGVYRNHLAALDIGSGAATAWDPNATGPSTTSTTHDSTEIDALAISGSTLYAGGNFTAIGGQTRNRLAAFDLAAGQLNPWNPNADNTVYALAALGSRIYAGGTFTTVGGMPRARLAALDAATGTPTPWNPDANGSVYALAPSGSTLYAGGAFTYIGGRNRLRIAALDTLTTRATNWNPDADNTVRALAAAGPTIYVGGGFKNIGGQPRNFLAELDTVTTAATAWNPDASDWVYSLGLRGATLYAGGIFQTIGGQSTGSLVALDRVSALPFAWRPQCSGGVYSLNYSNQSLYAGGRWTTINGQYRYCFAQFDLTTPPGAPTNPAATAIQTDRITWTWRDNASNEAGFQVYAGPGATAPTTITATMEANATAYPVTGLAANSQHAFRVAAFNEYGSSAKSNAISAWTAIEPVASLVFSNIQTDRVTVAPGGAFSNLAAGSSGVLIYNKSFPESPGWQKTTAPVTFSNFGDGLIPNTRYTFIGRARNAAGVEATQTTASVCTLAGPPMPGYNIDCDRAPWQFHPMGASFTFTNPIGFGAGVQGSVNHHYFVSGYKYAWDTAPTHAFTGSEPTWNAGALTKAPNNPGCYYLHLQSINGDGLASLTLDYGPFYHALPVPTTLNLTPTTSTWVTDAPVRAIAPTSSTVYIGGDFSYVGPLTGSGVTFNVATGKVAGAFPRVDGGAIRVCTPDGAGGWFIGGDFTSVGGVAKYRLAHILPSGAVDPAWSPVVNNSVRTLAVSGSTLYVGGAFTYISGLPRKYIAAFDLATGALTPWNPDANDRVYALALSGSTLYVGGRFTTIGGQPRNCLAALDTLTTGALAWNPNVNGAPPPVALTSVNSLAISGSTVYIGGYFRRVGSLTRNYLAAVDATTGLATAWDPNPDGLVSAMAFSGPTLYIGGGFSKIGNQNRSGIAALDLATGAPTSWNPQAGGGGQYYDQFGQILSDRPFPPLVLTLLVSDGVVYAGGDFTTLGGQTRCRIAAIDPTTGMPLAGFNTGANGTVYALALSGSTLYTGGDFTSAGGVNRAHLAAIDPATGAATAWNPDVITSSSAYLPFPTASVKALILKAGVLYFGGDFNYVGGKSRNRLAAVDAASGALIYWNPSPDKTVNALAIDGGTIYAGGAFTSIGGQYRNRIAALDLNSGAATMWNPDASDVVNALAVSGSSVYAGGVFTLIGGQPRNRLAALDKVTGAATAWNPDANLEVDALALSGNVLYAGGDFTTIGGQARQYLAEFDTATGLLSAWKPSVFGAKHAIAFGNSMVYAGGAGPLSLQGLDVTRDAASGWVPDVGGNVFSLAATDRSLFVGGDFTSVNGQPQAFFTRFDKTPAAPTNPGAWNVKTDQITWTWVDNATDEDGFKLWADPGLAAPSTLLTTTTANAYNRTQSGLVPNSPYTFQVAATLNGIDSPRSNAFTTWTLMESVTQMSVSRIGTDRLTITPTTPLSNLASGASGVRVYERDRAGIDGGWRQDAGGVELTGLTPNAVYNFAALTRNASGIESPLSMWQAAYTLSGPPRAGQNIAADVTTGTALSLGASIRFSNPAGFGVSTHQGSPFIVSRFRFAWNTSPSYTFGNNESTWITGTLTQTTWYAGVYYLHLQAINAVGMPQPQTFDYGPFRILTPAQLTPGATALNFLAGTRYAVDVERGGAPTTQSLTLVNTGEEPLTFTGGAPGTPGLALSGRCAADFRIDRVTPATTAPLAPGASVTVVIRFAPSAIRRTLGLDAALNVTSNSPVTPALAIPLLGDAVPVEISAFTAD